MFKFLLTFVMGLMVVITTATATATAEQPFGGKEDVAFAKKLWLTLKKEKFVGPERINVQSFEVL